MKNAYLSNQFTFVKFLREIWSIFYEKLLFILVFVLYFTNVGSSQCNVDLGHDKDLCNGAVTIEAVALDIECTDNSSSYICDCPPGFTQITSTLYKPTGGPRNLCFLGNQNYTVSGHLDTEFTIYACGGAHVTLSSPSSVSCLDIYSLNGSDVSVTGSGDRESYFFYIDGSSAASHNGSGAMDYLHIFNAGSFFINANVDIHNIYAVGAPCATTNLSLNSNKVGNYYATSNVASQNSIAGAIIADPLSSVFNNFGGCSNHSLREQFSSKSEICDDGLDNDFDCDVDENCGNSGPATYCWTSGGQNLNIHTPHLTVTTSGEYCLTVKCDGEECTDCIDITECVADPHCGVDLGPDVNLCNGSITLNPTYNGNSGCQSSSLSYEWSTGSTNSSIHVSNPGTYSVTITDCSACISTDLIIVSDCQNDCGVILGTDTDLCNGAVTIEPISLDLDCSDSGGSSYICDCPPGFTQITSTLYKPTGGPRNLCFLGNKNYTVSGHLDTEFTIYACGGAHVTLSSPSSVSCLDIYSLNGSDVSVTGSGDRESYFFYIDGSSAASHNGSGAMDYLHIFNAGSFFINANVDVHNIYAVGAPCATTNLSLNSNKVGNYYATSNVASQNSIAGAIIADPLSSVFNNFGGCSNHSLREQFSSKSEICDDGLDNDFDCDVDENCGNSGAATYFWTGGGQNLNINTPYLTVTTAGEYCLTVNCDGEECTDCITLDQCVVNPSCTVDLGPDVDFCNGNVILSPTLAGLEECEGSCASPPSDELLTWSFGNCSGCNALGQGADYSELTPTYVNDGGCIDITATNVYRDQGPHSCAPGFNGGSAICVGAQTSCNESANDSDLNLVFEFTINPTDGGVFSGFSFYEKAPSIWEQNFSLFCNNDLSGSNNYPQQYFIEIYKDNSLIYSQYDISTTQDWTLESYDFSNNPAFELSASTTFRVELRAYCQVGNGSNVSIWDIDEIQVFGGCCDNVDQPLTYQWSDGSSESSLEVLEAGNYSVTVTDCTGCSAVDEVLVLAGPDAGTIAADIDTLQICSGQDIDIIISATPDGNINVPAGYEVLYVLTQGVELVIINANDSPSFIVPDAGDYTIHTLVYDATTLDLSIIEFGTTTGFDVNALLLQGGGSICASLDAAGAPINVAEISPTCGDLMTENISVQACDVNEVTISADQVGTVDVPSGFTLIYVLSQGNELDILETSVDPEFTVTSSGRYAIHTLIYDSTTIDLDFVTSGIEINSLLTQGRGDICGCLDVPGVVIDVELIDIGNAGMLSPGPLNQCFEPGNTVLRDAIPSNIVIPNGNSLVFILVDSNGNIIDQNSIPEFEISAEGAYSIHTVVYSESVCDISSLSSVTELLTCPCIDIDLVGLPILVEICNAALCPDNLYVPGPNTPVNSGLYEASQKITSDGIIMNGDVNYSAGETVELMPGFEIMTGHAFEAYIEGCNSNEN